MDIFAKLKALRLGGGSAKRARSVDEIDDLKAELSEERDSINETISDLTRKRPAHLAAGDFAEVETIDTRIARDRLRLEAIVELTRELNEELRKRRDELINAAIKKHRDNVMERFAELDRALAAAEVANLVVKRAMEVAIREVGAQNVGRFIPNPWYGGMVNGMGGIDHWRKTLTGDFVATALSLNPPAAPRPPQTPPPKPGRPARPTPDANGDVQIVIGPKGWKSGAVSLGHGPQGMQDLPPGAHVACAPAQATRLIEQGAAAYASKPDPNPIRPGAKSVTPAVARPAPPDKVPPGHFRVIILRNGYETPAGLQCRQGDIVDLPVEIAEPAAQNGAVEFVEKA